MTKRVTIPRS